MGGSTSRKSVIKLYSACKYCEDNIHGYGKCNQGYDNFYYRKGKNNGCDKCSYCRCDSFNEEEVKYDSVQ